MFDGTLNTPLTIIYNLGLGLNFDNSFTIFSLDLEQPTLSTSNRHRIIENDDVILKCLLHATLPVKFSWFKNGVLLPGKTNEKLLLSKINRRQKGEYKCVTINSVGSKESNLLVIDVKCKFHIWSEAAVQRCFQKQPLEGFWKRVCS